MKWLLIVVAVLLLLGLAAFIVMAMQSHKTPENIALQNGLLRPCPASPNCVCSEVHTQNSEQHAIAPIKLGDRDWSQMRSIILEQGGMIQQESDSYLHATFTTPVFRYIDDVELRLDQAGGLIHIRSASRVGRSDFGVNRKRVTQLTQ
ncbi:DUF1499 domain-containing protein [Mariprofundus sp. NF]|uniref:DUF1499 domain-containing protein n=1 Tax=Mariprofundus sp. NF TaxID=2608716 RepID=UPI0015A1BD26|nr:DUF1499 domain-containing protein [Mariprofundus sp. NF]